MTVFDQRRPIDPSEVPHLQELGQEIRDQRMSLGLTLRTVADRAQITPSSLCMIEHGQRRSRASTLRRILTDGLEMPEVLENCIHLAGPSLAPESEYAERIERRRMRRWKKRLQRSTHVSVAE